MRILLIDDDEINNRVNTLMIQKVDPEAQIEVRTSVDQGLEYLRACSPNDLPEHVFLDINLPIKSGWQFIEELRPMDLNLEIYMLTSSVDLLDPKLLEQYPEVKQFVEKPLYDFRLKELLHI